MPRSLHVHALGDAFSELEYFLRYHDPASPEFDLAFNRYLLGTGYQFRDEGSENIRHFLSQPFSVGEFQGQVDELFGMAFPPEDHPLFPLRGVGRYAFPVGIAGVYTPDGVPIYQSIASQALDPACAFSENSITMRITHPFFGIGCDSFQGGDVNSQPPFNVPGTKVTKVKSQVRMEPGSTACLYDIRIELCLRGNINNPPRLNCRSVKADAAGIIEIPAPPLGFRTYFDEFCDCGNPFP